MIKWDLLLCGPAFFELALELGETNPFAKTPIRNIIGQHHLIVSEELLDTYEKYYQNHAFKEVNEETSDSVIQGCILQIYDTRCLSTYKWVENDENDESKNDLDAMLRELYSKLISESYKPLLIWNANLNMKTKNYQMVHYANWKEKEITNKLTRNSNPFDYLAVDSEDDVEYKEWFKELFNGENTYNIFDSHFLKQPSRDSFLKYYLPNMPMDSDIVIYCQKKYYYDDERECLRFFDVLKLKAQQKRSRIQIIDSKLDPEHDRFIYTDNYKLYIGVGLDFLSAKDNKVRSDSQLNVSECRPKELQRLKEKYPHEPFISV